MFFIIPFSIILISAFGICFIVWRKRTYLNKLTPEANEVGDNLFYDFFPEVTDGFKKFNWREHKEYLLSEFEKNLRRIRLFSLKIDHAMLALINKVRNISVSSESEKGKDSVVKTETHKNKTNAVDELKKKEQALIIEIAKDPKNADLYLELGNLYTSIDDSKEAKEAYEAALKLRPDDSRIASKLSRLGPSI